MIPHDVGLLHDEEVLAINLDLCAGPLAEKHAVTDLLLLARAAATKPQAFVAQDLRNVGMATCDTESERREVHWFGRTQAMIKGIRIGDFRRRQANIRSGS